METVRGSMQDQKLYVFLSGRVDASNAAEVENETLTFIVDTIKKVIPDFNAEAKQNEMILLYRINNTLHFVNNLYTSKDGWNVDTELLYKLFYELFLKMADN